MNNIPNKGSFEQITSRTSLTADALAQISLPMPNKPDVALASSRAWLARGQFWLATNDTPRAIMCAKAGLEELGSDYASPKVYDDTKMKLWVAQERIGEGYLEDGAEIMLRVLGTRLYLYDEQLKEA